MMSFPILPLTPLSFVRAPSVFFIGDCRPVAAVFSRIRILMNFLFPGFLFRRPD